MVSYLEVLITTLPIFGIVGTGILVRKMNWLTEAADKSLMTVIINLLFPCLILDKLLGNPALGDAKNLLFPPLVGFGTVCVGFLVARLVAPLASKEPVERRTFTFSTGMYNYGFLPLPLAIALFDRETTGVLFIHNVGVEAALWSVGLLILAGKGEPGSWKKFLNLPLAAIAVGVSLTLLGLDGLVPPKSSVRVAMEMLGMSSIPISLILIGATIYDFLTPRLSRHGLKMTSLACLLRLGLLPLMFVGLILWLPCSQELKQVMALQAAMPCAVFPLILAKHYDGDIPTAMRAVLGTSALSCFTMPLWLQWTLSLL